MSIEKKKRRYVLCPFPRCARLMNFNDFCSEEIHFYRTQSIELRTEVEKRQNALQAMYALFDKGYQIIGIDQSAKGEILAVVCNQRTPNGPPTDFFYLYPLPFANADDHVGTMCLRFSSGAAYIEEIVAGPPGQGHGSILMKHILSFLRTIGCEYVTGTMSYVDRDHWDLLQHFYEKFGFTITDCISANGMPEKSIKLRLLNPRRQAPQN